jgi:hypothetical protein
MEILIVAVSLLALVTVMIAIVGDMEAPALSGPAWREWEGDFIAVLYADPFPAAVGP